MTEGDRSGETFLVCRYSFNLDESDDFVEVTAHARCVDALEAARSWYGVLPSQRRAAVWVGTYQVFDSERVVDFDLAARHRPSVAPAAAGVFGYEWINNGYDYRFVLIKRGLGQFHQKVRRQTTRT